MTEFMVDNRIYKKVKYFEIGICFSLFIIGGCLYFFESGDEITSNMILGIVLVFIGNGIAISWWFQSLYFKKVDLNGSQSIDNVK